MEHAALHLLLIESLLTSIAASLESRTGAPSPECTFNSILAAQALVGYVRETLEGPGHA